MPTALLLIADGSEEIEFVTPYDVLTRAGFSVKSAGVNLENRTHAVCSRNVRILPDEPAVQTMVGATDFDVLILPGGGPGAKTFCDTPEVLDLIRTYRAAGKVVAFICAATTALVKSGGDKVKVTSHPSVKAEIEAQGWQYADEEERVVVDREVITSRGPGTAILFSLTIVEALVGKGKREEIAGPMICASTL
ncbi:class I glutamine amidotransferase-like protein [Lineolata rhizophorae]|uniref:D-lactate dehydratase n=1 Tax=Lineolata rhizophorae TaxID=578093 RepID=A0A6A6P2X1_9PEZI|nr:class I glutamine amidotransferase-like protein [Lineolata rhizophorae]